MADNATATLGIEVKAKGTEETKRSLDGVDQSVNKLADSTKKLGNSPPFPPLWPPDKPPIPPDAPQKVSALSKAFDFMRGVFSGASAELSRGRAVHSLYAAAAGQTTEAVVRTASATHGLRGAMETLRPVLAGAGVQLGGFGGLLGAARAGFGGLAIAIGGGLLASIERVNESTETLRKRFTAVSGNNKQFEQLKQIARDTGASISDLASVTQTLNGALERGQTGRWVGDLSQINQNSTLAAKSLADLSKAAGADFGAVSDALKGVLNNGKLTEQVFIGIARANEAVALGIAKAFHYPTIAAFAERLKLMPADARELKGALEAMAPTFADAASKANTLSAAIGKVKQGINDVSEALGGKFVSTTISAFGTFLSWVAKGITELGKLQQAALNFRFPQGTQVGSLGKVADIVANAQGKNGPSFQQGDTSGSSTLFEGGASGGFGPPPGSVTAPSSGGFVEPPNSITGQQFMGEEFIGAFASGGSFMVGGAGGTDSKRIAMNVTPGERVTVTPPQQGASPGIMLLQQLVSSILAAQQGQQSGQRPILQNFVFPNVTQAQPFLAAAAQIKRASLRALI